MLVRTRAVKAQLQNSKKSEGSWDLGPSLCICAFKLRIETSKMVPVSTPIVGLIPICVGQVDLLLMAF